MDKIHFGHMCFAAATMTGMATIASMLGHADGTTILHVCGTAIGIIVLTPLYANFK